VCTVPGQFVEFGERSLVKQQVDPLTRGQLAARVLPLDGRRRTRVNRLRATLFKIS
jgi:hypothetical protein